MNVSTYGQMFVVDGEEKVVVWDGTKVYADTPPDRPEIERWDEDGPRRDALSRAIGATARLHHKLDTFVLAQLQEGSKTVAMMRGNGPAGRKPEGQPCVYGIRAVQRTLTRLIDIGAVERDKTWAFGYRYRLTGKPYDQTEPPADLRTTILALIATPRTRRQLAEACATTLPSIDRALSDLLHTQQAEVVGDVEKHGKGAREKLYGVAGSKPPVVETPCLWEPLEVGA